jgi:hypothetical protein
MAALSPAAAHHRARIAAIERCVKSGERRSNDPELIEARRNLRAERLADHVKSVVDQAPRLTREQIERIAAILRGGDVP